MQVSRTHLVPNSLASMELPYSAARYMAGLDSMLVDLDAVAQVADRLSEILSTQGASDRVICESLTWHIVVRYGCCFVTGKPSKLERIHVANLKDADLLMLHDGLLERRHKTFAHAGEHCTYKLVVHLLEGSAPGAERLHVVPWLEGPGPIADPEQSALIARLARSLMPVVEALKDRTAPALQKQIEDNYAKLAADLKARLGQHASPEQFACSAMRRFEKRVAVGGLSI